VTWIKMRTTLHTDPSVVRMAKTLNLPEYAVVGLLHRVWSWADEHLTDGHAKGIDPEFLDRLTGVTLLSRSMRDAGWLTCHDDGSFSLPNFDRHLSKGAKTRFLASERKNRSRFCHATSVTETGQERDQRREEKRREELNPPTPQGGAGKLAEMVDVPEQIRTPRFWEVWQEWRKHRREKRQGLKPTSERKQLAEMAKMGETRAITAIEWSMKNGYTGIFEPSGTSNGRTGHRDAKRAGEYPEGDSLLPVL
jgi:hypothetical protein